MCEPKFIQIAAISENDVIGKNGKLPWRNKEDALFLKKTVSEKVCIIGRKSFEEIPKKSFMSTTFIVLTKNLKFNTERKKVKIVHNLAEGLRLSVDFSKKIMKKSSIFIMGGREIYKQTEFVCSEIWFSKIPLYVTPPYVLFPNFYNHSFKKKQSKQMDGYVFEKWIAKELPVIL